VPPLISVILPCCDRPAYLRQALQSLQRQTFRDFEVVLADDGLVPARVEPFAGLVLVRCGPRGGAASARNLAVQQAAGEFLAFLDDDDVWAPDFLTLQLAALRKHPGALLSFTGHRLFGADVRPVRLQPLLSYGDLRECLLGEFLVHTMSLVMLRRQAWRDLDPTLPLLHDNDLYVRLAEPGAFVHLPTDLVWRRIHRGNLTDGLAGWEREERAWLERQAAPSRVLARRDLFFASQWARRGLAGRAAERLVRGLRVLPQLLWRRLVPAPLDRELERLGILIEKTGQTG